MGSMVDEIADYLVTQSVATAKGIDIYASWLTDALDDCIALYETPGAEPVRTMGTPSTRVTIHQPNLQVVVRNVDYQTGMAKAKLVQTKLDGFVGTLGSTRYLWIASWHEPYDLGKDEQGRFRFICNYRIMKDA